MSPRRARAVAVALVIVLAVVGARLAVAEPRVIVTGDDAAIVAAVRDGLRRHATLLDADAVGSDAIVKVAVTGRGKKLTATAIAYGRGGAELARLVVRDRRSRLAAAVKRAAWKQLGRGLASTQAPPTVANDPDGAPQDGAAPPPLASPPAPTASSAPIASEPDAPDARAQTTVVVRRRAGPARLRVAVDERPFWRRLRYNDDYRRVTRSYDLGANAIGVELGVRPVATQPRLELIGTGMIAIGVNGSRTRDGTGYPTQASEWSIGAGYGGTLGAARLAARLGYGEHRFTIADDAAMGAELVPDVTYRWARLGLDCTLTVAPRWRVLVSAGGRYLFGTGDLTGADWFPRATGYGVDGTLGAGWRLARRFSLYARAEVRHYFFAMNPEVGDPMIVGGATDSYLGGAVGASLELW